MPGYLVFSMLTKTPWSMQTPFTLYQERLQHPFNPTLPVLLSNYKRPCSLSFAGFIHQPLLRTLTLAFPPLSFRILSSPLHYSLLIFNAIEIALAALPTSFTRPFAEMLTEVMVPLFLQPLPTDVAHGVSTQANELVTTF